MFNDKKKVRVVRLEKETLLLKTPHWSEISVQMVILGLMEKLRARLKPMAGWSSERMEPSMAPSNATTQILKALSQEN